MCRNELDLSDRLMLQCRIYLSTFFHSLVIRSERPRCQVQVNGRPNLKPNYRNQRISYLDAGYTRQQILEVIVGMSYKVISNYTNHIADTPVDTAFKKFAWEKPAVDEAA